MVTLQDMRNWKKTKIHNVYIGKHVLLPQLLNFLFQNVKNSHLGIHAHNSVFMPYRQVEEFIGKTPVKYLHAIFVIKYTSKQTLLSLFNPL